MDPECPHERSACSKLSLSHFAEILEKGKRFLIMATAAGGSGAPAGGSAGGSAATSGTLREDLTCAICCDLFREPVMLACMHHFCRQCICRYWRGTQSPVTCPQCRKQFSSKQFQTNYLVAAMVEKVRATTSDSYIKNLEVSSQHNCCGCKVHAPLPVLLYSVRDQRS